MKVTKIFKIETAHRVINAYTKRCAENIHGHSAQIEFTFEADCLDEAQMVIDFTIIKKNLKPFIDMFDHTLVICNEDIQLKNIVWHSNINKRWIVASFNPTAEMFAKYFYEVANWFFTGFVYNVKYWETSTGNAEFNKDDLFKDKLFKTFLVDASKEIKQENIEWQIIPKRKK